MIIVIVWEKDGIERWEIIERDTRIGISLGSCPLHRTRSLAPDRICQEVESMGLYEYSCMSDIGHLRRVTIVFEHWFDWCDFSFFPERYFLIEYPLIEWEESVFAFSAKKLFLCLCQAKCLSGTPTDIEKLSTIKMIRCISSMTLARMVTIHQKDNTSETQSTGNKGYNNTLKHRNIDSKTPEKMDHQTTIRV